MLHSLSEQEEDHGVPQMVVRPQRGAAVRAEEAVLHLHPGGVIPGIKAAARPDGDHHIHMSLQDQQGSPLPARRGGHIGHHIPRLILNRREPQLLQPFHQIAALRRLVA